MSGLAPAGGLSDPLVITYLPLAGVVLIALFGKGRPLFFKVVSLVVTLAAFGLRLSC